MDAIRHSWHNPQGRSLHAPTLISFFLIASIAVFYLARDLKNTLKTKSEQSGSLVLRSSPIDLPRSLNHTSPDSSEEHAMEEMVQEFIIENDLWFNRVSMQTINAPWETLHHAVIYRRDLPNPFCQSTDPANFWRALVGAGRDTPEDDFTLPKGYGIFLPAGTRLTLKTMWHNADPPIGPGGEFKNASFEFKFKLENATPAELKSVDGYYFMHLSDEPCSWVPGFTVPPNAKGYVKRGNGLEADYTFPNSGDIILIQAHLHQHEGGQYLDLEKNGKLWWRFQPFLTSLEPWSWKLQRLIGNPILLHIERGDRLSLAAMYDNPSPQPLKHVMGVVVFYFLPDKK